MTSFLQDVRYALRTLGRNRGFAAAAVTILAIGIGFNAAAFSLIDAVVLSSLPGVPRPGELVDLTRGEHSAYSYPSYKAFREGSRVFSGLAAWGNRSLGIAGRAAAERIRGTVVSANYFDVLGVRPALGRFFLPGEEESGQTFAVLSHGLWQRRFGAARSAIGTVVVLNGAPFTVIGVAPRGFRGAGFGAPPDVWIPIGAWPGVATGALARLDHLRRGWEWMSVFGRLSPGTSSARAAAAVNLIAEREARDFPTDTPKVERITLVPLGQSAAGANNPADPVRFFTLLLGAVAVALLIACANLANLLLARALARRREIGVRQALGASRGRLLRQMLTESVVLALAGGAAGLFVANWSVALAAGLPLPGGATLEAFGPSVNGRVLLFAFLLSVATGALFGLVPALAASRAALVPALKDEAPGGRRAPFRSLLVAAQVALCLVLLACAGLLTRSLSNALATDPGFQSRGVALASVHLGLARYDGARAWTFAREAASRAAALPGVRSVAWAGMLPLSGDSDVESASPAEGPPSARQAVNVTAVGPGYFATLGIPIVAGREFDDAAETPGGPPAIVVNEAAARRFWPGQNPLGRRLRISNAERTVVGVSRDSLFLSLRDRGVPLVSLAIQQLGGDGVLAPMTLLVRSGGRGRAALPGVRTAIAGLDGNLPVFGLRTLEESIADELVPQRFGSAMIGIFALFSFVLAAVGVYAVVAASVSRRGREMGIRIALGARPAELRRMILRQTTAPIAAGLALGLPLAAAATRLLSRFLYGVTPTDAVTFAGAILLLGLGGLAAADLPARRAARVSPMEALRNE